MLVGAGLLVHHRLARPVTSALVITALLSAAGDASTSASTPRKLDAAPGGPQGAEIADGAGELGFFPPHSWWPLWCGATLGVMFLGIAVGLVAGHHRRRSRRLALCGWIFEYYRGEHAH